MAVSKQFSVYATRKDVIGRSLATDLGQDELRKKFTGQHARAEESLRIAAMAFDVQEGIIITDANNIIIRVNQSFTRLTGYSAEQAIGNTPALLKSDQQPPTFYQEMWTILLRNKHWQGMVLNKRRNGESYPAWLNISAITDQDGVICNYVGTLSDMSAYKQTLEAMHNLSYYDPLTQLPNRCMMIERLESTITCSARHHSYAALLFIDLDNFKNINDTRGHEIGDQLLVDVGRRLQHCVRSDDMVAKIAGDEYVVIIAALGKDVRNASAQAGLVAEKIRTAATQSFMIRGEVCHISASIGINLINGQAKTVDELLKHTDAAMYQAKRAGRNTWRFFDPTLHAALETRMAVETDLHYAVTERQFKLYYQAQVNNTGRIIGAEALIRWDHPTQGLVYPNDFIPLAEETGLILPIGQWVLETACEQIKAWENTPHANQLSVAVNISARQFAQVNFVESVSATLKKYAINPNRLKLELTESLLLDDVKQTIDKMQALKQLGVRFSLDDFGTGYSSLAYLTHLPLDQLKIDRSFVSHIVTKPNHAAIVQTIIYMAHNLNLEVIAEGVETEEQQDFLNQNGCALYQGYLYGKPLPLAVFERALERNLC